MSKKAYPPTDRERSNFVTCRLSNLELIRLDRILNDLRRGQGYNNMNRCDALRYMIFVAARDLEARSESERDAA